jgi:hypothetical protein
MTQKKDNTAELQRAILKMQKIGFNPMPLVELFTSWYTPDVALEEISDTQAMFGELVLKDQDIEVFREEALKHHQFLNHIKITLKECLIS